MTTAERHSLLLSRACLVGYLAVLTWLVLFKLSFDPASMLRYRSYGRVAWLPFQDTGAQAQRDVFYNLLAFVPFGLLISTSARGPHGVLARWVPIILCSMAFEGIQLVTGIGAADATDVVTNSTGGLIGLVIYGLAVRAGTAPRVDWLLARTCALGLAISVVLVGAQHLSGQHPRPSCAVVSADPEAWSAAGCVFVLEPTRR